MKHQSDPYKSQHESLQIPCWQLGIWYVLWFKNMIQPAKELENVDE
jgi:hypothetical protein